MKATLVLALLLAATSATPKSTDFAVTLEQEPDVVLSERILALCETEGGCTIYTRLAYDTRIEAARMEAFKAGFEAGLVEARKQRGML